MSKRTVLAVSVLALIYGSTVAMFVLSRPDVMADTAPPPAVEVPVPAVPAPAAPSQQQIDALKQAYQAAVAAKAAQAPVVAVAAPNSTLLDVTTVLQPVLEMIALVIAGLITRYVPRALDAMEKRTGIQLTDQQRAKVLGAVQTAAGIVETDIDRKAMSLAQVHVDDPVIRAQAAAVIAAVPQAAAALGVTEAGVARMIVGAANTGPRAAPVQPQPAQAAPNPLAGAPGGSFVNPPL